MNEALQHQDVRPVDPDQSDSENQGGGLSPNARLVYICPDQIGLWRLRKSLALDDARWYFERKRMVECRQLVGAARFNHREIMRIKRFVRDRKVLPQQAVEIAPVQPAPEPSPLDVLAPRERKYLMLLALGWSKNRIAKEMAIKVSTTHVYHHTTASKLELKPAQLAAYAISQGWTAGAR